MSRLTGAYEHTAARPDWECRSCGKDWPCEPARAALAAEHAEFPTSVRVYLGMQYARALDDHFHAMTDFGPGIYQRFFSWLPARTTPDQ